MPEPAPAAVDPAIASGDAPAPTPVSNLEIAAPVARPSLTTRTLLALVVGQLGVHAAMAGLRMAAALQALQAGDSAWAVGLLLSLFAGAAVLSALGAGRMADRHGYHRPVALAVVVTLVGMACALASTAAPDPWRFTLLCVAAAATGMGANTGMLAVQRTAGRAAANATERVRVFSWLGVAPSFSNVVGPVAAGFMIDAAGYAWAYALLLALPLLTLAAARVVPREPPRSRSGVGGAGAGADPGTGVHGAGPERKRKAWDLLRVPAFRRLMWVNGLLSMCWDVHTFAVPVLGHERGFSAATIGLILGAFTLAVTGVRLVIPLLAHRLQQGRVVHAAMWACALVFAVYPLAPTPLTMGVCAVLLGLALGCVQPMVMSLLHDAVPADRQGAALALRSMVINASSTVLPLAFGAAGALAGAGALFWVVALAVGGGSPLARRLQPGTAP
jgi:MFS family permease